MVNVEGLLQAWDQVYKKPVTSVEEVGNWRWGRNIEDLTRGFALSLCQNNWDFCIHVLTTK